MLGHSCIDEGRRWPCQVCNLPGRYVTQRGEACEQCKRDIAAWDPPAKPPPSAEEILPPRYRDKDFHDALNDARAELVGEGVYVSERDAVIASLNAPRGNADLYPVLRDRHPFGWSPFTVPTDGHRAPAFPAAGATPTGLRPSSPPSAGTQADGSPDLPTAA